MAINPMTMMMIGQGINAGAGLLSGLLGKSSQDAAAAYNHAVNAANLQRQDQSAFMQQLLAREYQQMAQAGNTNARGDRTEYIPGVGWVTTPSAATAGLISASDAEQRARLTSDSVTRRRGLQENESRRIREGQAADVFLQQLMQQPDYSMQSLRDELLNRVVTDTNKAFDRTADRIGTQALRSGASNAGDIMRSLNAQRADAVRSAGAGAISDARQLFEQLETARTGRAGNLYNLLASRASNFDDVPFQPSNVNDSLQAFQTGQRGNALGMAGTVMTGMSAPGGRIQQINPNFSSANFIGGAGSNIGGMIEQWGAQQQMNDLMKMFANRQLGNQSA